MGHEILFWRRIDVPALERLSLDVAPDAVEACSCVVGSDDGGYRLDYRWLLSGDWRTRRLEVERWGAAGRAHVVLERIGDCWSVDGAHRPDLDGAEEPDLSVTPFCNTLPIRRTPRAPGASLTLDVCYLDGATMRVERSRQRYDRLGPDRLRYVDLGRASGFEAELRVDGEGLVVTYEHLFERVAPTP
ncbi:putative glycolipid-binding domain-containing protein [Salinarimonas ramus]|uniref:Glycolipid-binding domain-containing protein n=1 Tax=Salinarimonas ramus TaxID=690164 RepID=A0A917Q4G0_9HYPH|nr:putative glycolipid-binding domain-containing protein [Salinarimonas ramus]GGK24026.1 hypothetical protein GCM10011322_08330 [Salinarimonas ramus]